MRRAASAPPAQVPGGGTAHSGVHHWWTQRVSAVALLPLTIWFIVSLLRLPDLSWASVHSWLAGPWSVLAMVMFVLALCWHSHLGVQVVIEDYVHGAATKTVALLAGIAHLAVAVTALLAVLRITLAANP